MHAVLRQALQASEGKNVVAAIPVNFTGHFARDPKSVAGLDMYKSKCRFLWQAHHECSATQDQTRAQKIRHRCRNAKQLNPK